MSFSRRLQPVELPDVSERFAGEIVVLRRFLSQAGIRLGSRQATQEMAVRVAQDRAFHRDLTSHVWVMLDESGSSIRSADLLGVVIIAASGMHDAAETNEDDAHSLLRFLMEAKHTFQQESSRPGLTAARGLTYKVTDAGAQSGSVYQHNSVAMERREMPLRRKGISKQTLYASPEHRQDRWHTLRHRGFLYVCLFLCTISALLLTYVVLRSHRISEKDNATRRYPAGSLSAASGSPLPQEQASLAAPTSGKASLSGTLQRHRPEAPSPSANVAEEPAGSFTREHAQPWPSSASRPPDLGEVKSMPATPQTTRQETNAAAMLADNTSAPAGTEARPTVIGSKAMQPSASGSTVVAADTLSKRLDSPRLPAYTADPDESSKRKYPRLLRRHASDPISDSAEANRTLTAELRAPDLAGLPLSSRSAGSSMAVRGVVRSTCLGMMAGNLVYGPAPPYPAAAASARVQGEVKIQASVDRDGTIDAARVISGPPSLRDAALDAVQRWRFKPFTTGGKAAPTGAMAIVEFELQ